ncbi:hypothetical protein GCM10009117_14920 [Gangjinia marincola]|uniref:GH16 domain-containing protein n=1 Tax=Gangjinia marincola TaxID=578463 RepID=A0ABN1MGS2_9FLAO
MKKIVFLLGVISLFLVSCQEEDQEFGDVVAPTNLELSFEIEGEDADNPFGDGSGFVTFNLNADNAVSYRFSFTGNTTEVVSAPEGVLTYRFTEPGINTYNVTAIAAGTGGAVSSQTISIEVFSAFEDQEALNILSGGEGESKTWYLAASESGHLGVGPSIDFFNPIEDTSVWWTPSFFSAAPFGICSDQTQCLCNDELTFSLNNNQLTYVLNNNGETFFNAAHQAIVGGNGSDGDACFNFDTSGVKNVTLAPASGEVPSDQTRGTQLNFSDGGFMGYYVSSSSYEILEISENSLYVRTRDALNPVLAWYHKFTTTPVGDDTGGDPFDDLIFEDEFDVDGAPNPDVWGYDLGDGCPNLCGWGNNESQYYTDRPENVIVENGILKITARKENFGGREYTSARLLTKDKFDFQYGKVEVRAKLPTGGGTWPAIWMLGADIDSNPWPGAGEMDIMEHVGNNQDVVSSALHFPGNSGGNPIFDEQTVAGVSDNFNIYSVEWTEENIKFYVNDSLTLFFENSQDVPFNKDFFLLLNVAMGGNFGGTIDPNFVESTMEIDYVKVYQ